MQTALRSALGDQSLRIYYWAPTSNTYVDDRGRHASLERLEEASFTKYVTTHAQTPLALLTGDAVLNRFPKMVPTALNTSAIALENAQLQADIQSQLEEVRASRGRVAEAALAERQRIERDLHDGVQQKLLALAMQIGTFRRSATNTNTSAQLRRPSYNSRIDYW